MPTSSSICARAFLRAMAALAGASSRGVCTRAPPSDAPMQSPADGGLFSLQNWVHHIGFVSITFCAVGHVPALKAGRGTRGSAGRKREECASLTAKDSFALLSSWSTTREQSCAAFSKLEAATAGGGRASLGGL